MSAGCRAPPRWTGAEGRRPRRGRQFRNTATDKPTPATPAWAPPSWPVPYWSARPTCSRPRRRRWALNTGREDRAHAVVSLPRSRSDRGTSDAGCSGTPLHRLSWTVFHCSEWGNALRADLTARPAVSSVPALDLEPKRARQAPPTVPQGYFAIETEPWGDRSSGRRIRTTPCRPGPRGPQGRVRRLRHLGRCSQHGRSAPCRCVRAAVAARMGERCRMLWAGRNARTEPRQSLRSSNGHAHRGVLRALRTSPRRGPDLRIHPGGRVAPTPHPRIV